MLSFQKYHNKSWFSAHIFDSVNTASVVHTVASSQAIVCLGRYGDIINILPVAKDLARNSKIDFIVSSEFSDVLDGVSYVRKVVWDGDYSTLKKAIDAYRDKYSRLLIPQIYGRAVVISCPSFNMEAWNEAGYLSKWEELPLIFDNRNYKRERALWVKVSRGVDLSKPVVCLNTAGHSSPFRHTGIVETLLESLADRVSVIKLDGIKAHRVYDLIGVIDRCSAIITIDTATLHLAAASSTPVVALIADSPTKWHGSTPRFSPALKVRYSDVPFHVEDIRNFLISLTKNENSLIHVYSDMNPSSTSSHRLSLARQTWKDQYSKGGWIPIGVHDHTLPRLFDDGGMRSLPYIKDLVQVAVRSARLNDTVVLTNADTCFTDDISERLNEKMKVADAVYAHRRDFYALPSKLEKERVRDGEWYPGNDLFAFKVKWWIANGHLLPDLVLGAEAWDWCFRVLVQRTTQQPNLSAVEDIIYHEKHPSVWEHSPNRDKLPSNMHNSSLASKFLTNS